MRQPNLEHARQYALRRLEQELSPKLLYHSIAHTRDDVVPAAARFAEMEGVTGEDYLLLVTAAWFHDLGFIERYRENEVISVQIARDILPDFGYNANQIETVADTIMATQLPQTPHTHLQEIICDADLDVLGREDFPSRNECLRKELSFFGVETADDEWLVQQLEFLHRHHYFTPSALRLRTATKENNLRQLAIRLRLTRSKSFASSLAPGDSSMLSIAERVAILRSVSLFAETPDSILDEVADLLTPVEIPVGEPVFLKGDQGDCMYIIESGYIRIHDGDLVFNHLGPGEVFGEMALLDAEPRSATATAEKTVLLFRLNRDTFYQLMQNRPEVAKGVLRVLSRRLRGRVKDMTEDFQYIQQVGRVTSAAAALEAGLYDTHVLDEVSRRGDELGQLSRVFQRMADEVQARENRLKAEVQELRIQIDEAKRATQVAQITETEYFQQLQEKVRQMRKR